MKAHLLFIIILVTYSANASSDSESCDNKGIGHNKIIVPASDFMTKKDPKSNKNIFPPLLYCDQSQDSEPCNNNSFWFTLEGYVKNKALYKEIICYYKTSTATSKSVESKIVIYTNANK